ncbi:hypothetical protein BD414DRAFT_512473 [Trametes punicea]|nr:hypothetical protein BD414DRAFT_512473 [Trametes punicea]
MASVESVPAYLHPGVPVSQPAHLEGDPSLATEILPGPPPLSSIQQANLPRKDHKKTAVAYSYLPASDPGTTYSSPIANSIPTASTDTDMDGPRRKRARLDKGGERSRTQRATARNLAVTGPLSDPLMPLEATTSSLQLVPEDDPLAVPLDSDDAMVSRATTAHVEDTPPESLVPQKRGRGRSIKDNGKGKERERDPAVKVKEEPAMVLLSSETVPSLSNEDHCSACRSFGSLIYCDGCPRAFHLWCLDPPMETADLPEGDRWFCPACTLEQRPPLKPPASLKFMAPLVYELSTKIPSEYQLPQDIRTFFKDVGSSTRGTYVDTSEIKQARLNRHGQLEDRDPYRLKDRNGDPVLCFRCGTSALPPGLAADSPTAKRAWRAASRNGRNHETGRAIISCDYCHLHWHLDCLDPPLVFMPPWNKKWMCPNHAERVLQPKHRIPRANATPIEITRPHQWNNGIIDVVNTDEAPPPALVPEKANVDEVLINGRRYRVPERIITLDFWDKVARNRGVHTEARRELDHSSGLSSPLTSLTSLDDDESVPTMSMEPSLYTLEDVNFAQLLCGLRKWNTSVPSDGLRGSSASSAHRDTHTQSNTPATKPEQEAGLATDAPGPLNVDAPDEPTQGTLVISSARPRRAAASRTPAPTPAKSRYTRRSGKSTDEMSMDVDLPELVVLSGKRPDARRKAARPPEASGDAGKASEPTINGIDAIPKIEPSEIAQTPSASVATKSKRHRQHRRHTPPAMNSRPDVAPEDPEHSMPNHSKHESSTHIPKTSASASSHTSKKKTNGATEGAVPAWRSLAKPKTPPAANGQTSTSGAAPKTEATPTLKIRLPRLSTLHSPSVMAQPSVVETAKAPPSKAGGASSGSSRPRRSLRRQTSIPTSLNSVTTSDASSSAKINDNGLPTSPTESSRS